MPLEWPLTAAFGLMLGTLAHRVGWPLPRGGSQSIADALAAYFTDLGGEIVTNHEVKSLAELPPARAVLLDVTPRQLLAIAGEQLPARLSPPTGKIPLWAGRVQGGLGAERADSVASGGVPSGWDGAFGANAGRDGVE